MKFKRIRAVRHGLKSGFSLVELLTVMAVMAILTSLLVTSFNALGDAQAFGSQVSDFQQLFDDARAYAMANNTYVLVGIGEVNAAIPSSTVPQSMTTLSQTLGGRVAVAVCAVTDGTNGLQTSPSYGITSNLKAIHTLRLFPNVHIQSLYNINVPLASPLANRYSIKATGAYNTTLITQGQTLGFPLTTGATFPWPLTGTVQYTFNRVIDIGPDGSAFFVPSTATASTSPKWLEIALQETHGNTVPTTPTTATLSKAKAGQQVAAIQIDGITGTSQLYRQ